MKKSELRKMIREQIIKEDESLNIKKDAKSYYNLVLSILNSYNLKIIKKSFEIQDKYSERVPDYYIHGHISFTVPSSRIKGQYDLMYDIFLDRENPDDECKIKIHLFDPSHRTYGGSDQSKIIKRKNIPKNIKLLLKNSLDRTLDLK